MEQLRDQLNSEFDKLFEFRGDLLNQMATYHFDTGGKRFRGLLSLVEAQDLGVAHSDALKWGVACEVLHNATLVHDDIQDDDPLRRGQESAWIKFGRNQAINLGDYLVFLAFENLVDVSEPAKLPALLQCLATNAREVVQGQALELEMATFSPNSLWENYLKVAGLKTGALLKAPIQGIHLLAGRSPVEADLIAEPWVRLGLVYQINDDINDFLGKKQQEQSLKDFHEQKINSLVAWLSMDETHKNLIQDYLACEKGSKAHENVISKLREALLGSKTLVELNSVKQKFYEKFHSDTQGAAKNLLRHFLKVPTSKENIYHGPTLV